MDLFKTTELYLKAVRMVNCVHVYHKHVFKSSLLHVAFKMVEGQPRELRGSLGEDKLMREVGVHLSNEGVFGLWVV